MKRLLSVVVALIVVAAGGLFGGYLYLEGQLARAANSGDKAEVPFDVPRGASARSLGPRLARAGLIVDANVWRYYLFKQHALDVKAGRHLLRRSMTMAELGAALEKAPIAADVPITFIEGWRLKDADEALAEKGLIEPGAYVALAKQPSRFKAPFPLPADTLEGYLYPETYSVVPSRFNLEGLLQRQLDAFAKRFYEPHKNEIANSGRVLHEVVKMASMLEREEPTPAQRPLVAGILWKRIDLGFPLGVDATSRYELDKWNDRKAFLKRLRDKSDAYNTRHKPGLPPTPIGAPTVDALVAALRPKKSPYLYYLHDADRVLRPSRNAAEHEALRKKYNVY